MLLTDRLLIGASRSIAHTFGNRLDQNCARSASDGMIRNQRLRPLAAALLVGCLGFPIACDSTNDQALDPPRTNVLIVSLDTTRADHLGSYGHSVDTSPNLDRFARGATLFERAFAQSPYTPVSHASILTGLQPYGHGLRLLHGAASN